MSEIPEDIKKTAAWIAAHRLDLRKEAGQQISDLISFALRDERARNTSALAAKDAEIERYRKALSEILGYDRNFYDNGRPGYEAIARAALADEAEGRS